MTCRIRLYGPPSITNDGIIVQGLRRKTIALIAYLAVEARAKSRDTAATLLWPSSGQAAARGNLRTVIHDAGRVLPAGMLDAKIETLELFPCPGVSVDLWLLRQIVEGLGADDTDIKPLVEAAALFRGEFLEGFPLPDCSDFDLWQLQTAERLRRENGLILSRLVTARLNAGAVSEAVDVVVRLIALDPLEEASHRLAIEVYARCGRWAMALEQFDECRRILHEELDAELAVPLLHLYSLRELPTRVCRPLGYLEEGGRDRPERHRSLEQAIDWSYSLLTPDERHTLVQLYAFANGFDMRAAESICASTTSRAFRSSFAGLLDKSLVQISAEEPVRRFKLLESTREYVATRSRVGEGLQGVRERHAGYYSNLALKAEGELHGPHQMQWLETLDAAHPNVLEALNFLYSSGHYVRGLESAAALEWYWYRRGFYRLGIEQIQRFLDRTVDLVAPTRARGLHAAGWLTFLIGDWRAGHYLYAQSLHLSRQVHDPVCEQLALSDCGVVERWLGDVESGTRHAREGVEVARESGNPHSLARALVWAYATTGGHFVDAYPLPELEEAIALAERIGDPWLVAHAHNGLGDLHCGHGCGDKARVHYALALSGFLALGDRYLAAWTLEGMGRVETQSDAVQAAVARDFEALRLFDSLGDDLNVALMIARVAGLLGGLVEDSERARLAGASAGLVNARNGEDLARTPQVDEAMGYIAGLDESYPVEWHAGRALARATAVATTQALIESAAPDRAHLE